MSVVVLDTNFLGATYDPQTLQGFLRVVGDELTHLLVPEVVVWEWAEHAWQELKQAKAASRKLRRFEYLPQLPIPQDFDLPDPIEIAAEIVQSLRLHPKVRVMETTNQGAALAIRAQVLQIECGSMKRDTKTGAADQMVLETVRSLLATSGEEQLVLATCDRGLRKTCAAQLPTVSLVREWNECAEILGRSRSIETSDRRKTILSAHLQERLVASDENLLAAIDARDHLVRDPNDHATGVIGELVTTEIGPAQMFEIKRLREVGDGRTLTMLLQIRADVTKRFYVPVQYGPEEFEMEFDYSSTATRLVSAQAAARLSAGGEVEWFTLTSNVVVDLETDEG